MNKPPPIFLIVLLGLLLWGGEYVRRDPWEPDEARFTLVSREMREGHWLVPYRQGEFYSHKPPLMFWLANLAAAATGTEPGPVTIRFPTFLGAVMALWVATRLAARWFSIRAAWMSLLLVPSAFLFWNKGGFGQIDMLLCGLQMMALYQLYHSGGGVLATRWAAAHVFMGLAVLAKGPVGLLVPLGIYVTSSLSARDPLTKNPWPWIWGPMLALSLPGLWLAAAYLQGAPEGFFHELLFKQNVGRFAGEFGGHKRPFFYFLQHFPMDLLPLTLLLPLSWRVFKSDAAHEAGFRRLVAWIAFVILFFSLSASKRNLYILLTYPAAAMMIAGASESWAHVPASWVRRSFKTLWGFVVLFGMALAVSPLIPAIPFRVWMLMPAGMLVVGMALMARRRYMDNPFASYWLAWLAGGILLGYSAIGTFAYPALDDAKTPDEIIDCVQQHLDPTDRIIVYKWHGEIISLYTRRKGYMAFSDEALKDFLKTSTQSRHALVCYEKDWDSLKESLGPDVETRDFTSGHKKLRLALFSVPAPNGSG